MEQPAVRRATFARFLVAERGAITVDYVMLTTVLTGLGLAVMALLEDPLIGVAQAVEGVVEKSDTTAEDGSYRAYDPEGWDAMMSAVGGDWGAVAVGDELWVPTDEACRAGGDSYGDEACYAAEAGEYVTQTEERSAASETALIDRMRTLLTDDEYAVLIGKEDQYAALQIVLEENGYGHPEGWPDFRTF